ncbi:TlpA family protein disulfide reductase [Chitinophaga sp. CF118]|uniref:TlpA family protein disulfide reductase n=1 Tax=Chitinophaga sp. CF118 TaxID=1884367 RepID=UPI0035193748
MRVQVKKETERLSIKYDKAENAWGKAVDAQQSERVQDSLKAIVSAIHDQLSSYDNAIQQHTLNFISTHPDSYISGLELSLFVRILPLDTLRKMYLQLTPRIKESFAGKEISKEIHVMTAASPGSEATDFATVDINNKPLQLSSFRGSVVLLDFWASWCVPCRVSNPHLIALFNKYKSKGFTIIGIADDNRNPQAWRTAVEQDHIGIWYHVLRGSDLVNQLKGLPSEEDIGHKFAIYSLPVKILIDKNGVIIGRYGSEDEAALEKKLEEIL